jgi:hypothetical protein
MRVIEAHRVNLRSLSPRPELGEGPAPRSLGSITPREDFVAAFSRIVGGVFIIGGREPGSNYHTGEIWMISEEPAPTLVEVPGYELRYVQAATVGSDDRMLWILDHGYNANWEYVARLVRINLISLEHEVVFEGARNGYSDKQWLTVDHDGKVLLTASIGWADWHATVRFEADPYVMGTAVPAAMHTGQGALLAPPIVDANGYLYTTTDAQGLVVPVQVPELPPPSPNGINLEFIL